MVVRPTVIPEPSFAIPGVLAAVTGLSVYEGAIPVAAVTGILAAFLAFQVRAGHCDGHPIILREALC